MATEELKVVLSRNNSNDHNLGFGFSLLGKPGLPPIIHKIVDDSPAAESGEVESGDVILQVNEIDVNTFSTKEVLKCLRLSSDPVTLKIQRDPKIKDIVRQHMLSNDGNDLVGVHRPSVASPPKKSNHHHNKEQYINAPSANNVKLNNRTNGSIGLQQDNKKPYSRQQQHNNDLVWEPLGGEKPKAKYEAFMMTGEHILNISKVTPQPIALPKQFRKSENSHQRFNSHSRHPNDQANSVQSVPNSPNEMEMGHHQVVTNSAHTSPVSANLRDIISTTTTSSITPTNVADVSKSFNNFVRTSRSEDQLQQDSRNCISAVDIDVDDDVTSSLNTLLDTRPDVCTSGSNNSDRIVWTYNAPVSAASEQQHNKLCHTLSNGSSSSPSSSPLRSDSPQSPTSVSSSVMSSHSGSRKMCNGPATAANPHAADLMHCNPMQANGGGGGDFSVSEVISNISSPDYHDEDSMDIRDCVMEISDHSDSDSTLLVSEPRHYQHKDDRDHRIVIQVKGPDKEHPNTVKDRGKTAHHGHNRREQYYNDYDYDIENEAEEALLGYYQNGGTNYGGGGKSSPPISEDDSDVDSLHSYHYSPKAVDMPSAIRLANRLYSLDGFKKSDVSRHLSKNNEFSRAVADEYLKHFNFDQDTLDIALRKFLKQFSLTGETQERERVLVHFSKRFLDCNPGSFNSQDAVHTLTCAIMLLNTDLHTHNINRKMTCLEFIENLAGLNENENFPREVLKQLYHAIKSNPLEWARDEDVEDGIPSGTAIGGGIQLKNMEQSIALGNNPFLDVPNLSNSVEYKKGYVMRKCCYEANAKRTPFHKRSWKMFYCTLRDLVLYLHKDENGFRKNQMGGDNLHNAIRVHHALATKASDYTKKQYVFRLQTADQAEYLFQTSDSKELQSWIDTVNFVCASFSAPPLEAAVGSQKKFQRPLLPCSHTKLNFREQLRDHEERVLRLEDELGEHFKYPPERNAKSLVVQNYKEREAYLTFELKRYKTYAYILRSKISQYPELVVPLLENSIGELDEACGSAALVTETCESRRSAAGAATNRFITVQIKYYPKYEKSPIMIKKNPAKRKGE